uniref:uncharacterized protein LOC122599585 n=1 Tax=Erigeron canadensis TaxID=72917 RepID=UPI001CB9D54C|nr:uncharacterized protein LOC122599585 [Erigeron canadensis]
MHFQMKVQPISFLETSENFETTPALTWTKPVLKSRLKRLFDRKNHNNSEKLVDGSELEPSSVCLAKMVENFMEDTTPLEKPKCSRNRCNCFNGNINDISDDDEESDISASEILKSLTPCSSVAQRNLLADTSKLVEKHKAISCKRKDELRKLVVEGLIFIGHDASICKSHWDKTSSYPAGEYEYVDVMMEGGQERVLIDIDFRSEFEIARPTGTYKAILNSLPYIYVGQADRLQQIISIISEAAKLSLKKKGMPVPPWRKPDYMKSKWLSPYTRTLSPSPSMILLPMPPTPPPTPDSKQNVNGSSVFSSQDFESECGVFEMIIGGDETTALGKSDDGFQSSAASVTWQPPAIKPRNVERGSKLVVTGLASLFKEKSI